MLIAVLENPNYIINIGHVIRNVEALGVDALFVVDAQKHLDDNLEILRERKSLIKHSSGAVRFATIRRFATSMDCLAFLKADGFVSIGTSPDAGKANTPLHESRLVEPKLSIWFGSEANGLSEAVIDACDFCVSIPMKGRVESLNLASSTAVVLWEAVRQRMILKK